MTTLELANLVDADVLDGADLVELLEDVDGGDFGALDVDQEAIVGDIRAALEVFCDPADLTLIRDSHFVDYAQELAEDLDLIPAEYTWPTSCIDWDQAVRELQMDYTLVKIDGVRFWGRS